MHELVPTNVDDVDEHGNVKRDDDGELLEDLDRWDPEDEADSFNDLFLPIACHPRAPRGACRCGCCRRRFGALAVRFGVGR